MSFSVFSGTSTRSVFKTEIALVACVKWGEMLCSRLSGNRAKGGVLTAGPFYSGELSTEQELKSVNQKSAPPVRERDMVFSARATFRSLVGEKNAK